MDKTLGQIAFEAAEQTGVRWNVPWEESFAKDDWEEIAAAVAAAVKEEDARICEENIAGISYGRTSQGPCLSPCDKAGGGRHDGMTYAAAIRASIKEVK